MPKGIKLIDDQNKDLGIEDVGGVKVLKVFDVGEGGMMGGLSFSKISYASELKNISKGNKNKITIRPRVLTENMIDDQNSVQTLGGSITDVGQVFRLSTGIFDIDRFRLTLEAIAGGAITSVDDFESYADTTALRAVWVPNDLTNTPNTLETSIIQEGINAMAVQILNKTKSKNDFIERTYASVQDWSGNDGLQMQFRNDTSAIIEVHIIDSNGDGSKHILTTSGQGSYEFIELDFNNFIPIGAVPADLTDVKSIKFFVKTGSVGFFFVDAVELFTSSAFGTVDVELYDFGTEPAPTTFGTLVNTETVALQSGKKVYEIPFKASALTPDNFYGIVLTNPSVATVKVYGKNGSDQYTNGFAFDSTDDGTVITSTGSGDDLFFMVFALDEAIFNDIRFTFNASPGQGKISSFINDNASQKGKTTLFLGEDTLNRTDIEFATRQQTGVSVKMNKDELVLIDFEDDAVALATKIQATVYFTFINRTIHG